MEVLALVVWAFVAVGFVVVGLKGAYMSLAKAEKGEFDPQFFF